MDLSDLCAIVFVCTWAGTYFNKPVLSIAVGSLIGMYFLKKNEWTFFFRK